jgi:hypothetical protein
MAISISSPIPGMPKGKKAGENCIHLNADKLCAIFNSPDRPAVCRNFTASLEMCGESFEQAYQYLSQLEELTRGH